MPADRCATTEEHDLADQLLSAFASPFRQTNRLVRLDLAADAGLAADLLLAHRVRAHEAISEPYRLEVEALSADSGLTLKALLGVGAAVRLTTSNGGERVVSGVITRAEHLGSDGGAARYGLRIEPVLAVLDQRLNSRVFQDKSVPQIVAAILREHLDRNTAVTRHFDFEDRTRHEYPARSYCLQYRESDYAFIVRLLAEEGIAYRWRFVAADLPLHVLVLFDDPYDPDQSAQPVVRFHRADGTEDADTITGWHRACGLPTAATCIASYDYRQATATRETQATSTESGRGASALVATLEAYEPQSLYYGADGAELGRYALLRQQARDLAAQRFDAIATTRALAPGEWFELAGHPLHDRAAAEDRLFTVLSLDWSACSNLPDRQPSTASRAVSFHAEERAAAPNHTPFECRFSAVRRGLPIVPEYSRTEHAKPTAWGPQTATVVGPEGEEIHTDEFGRIKVQFHWQRPADHRDGGAGFDERSSTWMRIASPSAGDRWGAQFLPRVGQEVLVEFLEGDIDRPVVAGVLYNGRHRPPEFSGAGSLPANRTISGIKSCEVRGARYGELVFDDTTGEIQTKLGSEHGKAQLNLGYLAHPRTDGKAEPRGEGFELRTDAAGAVRAARGLLLSADARASATGHQMDRQELIGVLEVALSIAKGNGQLSATHEADGTDTAPQEELLTHLQRWEAGSNAESGEDGGRAAIAMTAPAGIAMGSGGDLTLAARTNLDVVTAQDGNLSFGQKFRLRAAQGLSLFAHRLGMKLVAAAGPLRVQAQSDALQLGAAKRSHLYSLEDVLIEAPRITLRAQGAQITLGNGTITTQCEGAHMQKAATHSRTGPAGATPDLPGMQGSIMRTDEGFALTTRSGKGVRDVGYAVHDESGAVRDSGKTLADGATTQPLTDTLIRPVRMTIRND